MRLGYVLDASDSEVAAVGGGSRAHRCGQENAPDTARNGPREGPAKRFC